MKSASVAVLGTFCLDRIKKPGREISQNFGGLYYTVLTLSRLMEDAGVVYPVCKIGEEDYKNITGQFAGCKNVFFDYSGIYPGKNNTVTLDYYSEEERIEYSTNLPSPFVLDELLPAPAVDLFIVNFISGREMRYNTFRAFRRRLKVPVFVDLHSIFMGFGKNGRRYYFKNKDWRRWYESGDIVQMNRREADLLSGRELRGEKDLASFGRRLLDKGAETVIFTLSSEGSLVCWKSGAKQHYKHIPAYDFGPVKDITGCGDVYSASYVFAYLNGAEPPEAADFAAKAAGVRASQNTSAKLHELRNILSQKGFLNKLT